MAKRDSSVAFPFTVCLHRVFQLPAGSLLCDLHEYVMSAGQTARLWLVCVSPEGLVDSGWRHDAFPTSSALRPAVPGLVESAPCVSFLPLKADDDAHSRHPIKALIGQRVIKRNAGAVVRSHTHTHAVPLLNHSPFLCAEPFWTLTP